MSVKKPALGKGLSALISPGVLPQSSVGFLPNLPIDLVIPNSFQPRIEIDPESLLELADSIRSVGIIEPLLVTKRSENIYELIAGERRWRASQLAGLKTVPVVVKEASPQEMLEMAIIENVQRKDLNALEEALAFEQLQTTFNLTHEQIATRMGLSRPAIANKIRLLALPQDIKRGLLEQKISEGHARALLGLGSEEKMFEVFNQIIKSHLSVRAVEELVRRLNTGIVKSKIKKTDRILDDKTFDIEKKLKEFYGSGVVLSRSKKGGKIVISFKNDAELEAILNKIK